MKRMYALSAWALALAFAARQALAASGKQIPYREITIGIRGEVKG
jgi:uncharacterized protein (DUF1501 family)